MDRYDPEGRQRLKQAQGLVLALMAWFVGVTCFLVLILTAISFLEWFLGI